jgi:cellulose synthase operon protein C
LEPAVKQRAQLQVASIIAATGRWDEAESLLRRQLLEDPKNHAVRSRLSELLWVQGEEGEARILAEFLGSHFNDGLLKKAADLTDLSRSMALVGRFDDANYAMERAIQIEPKFATAKLEWAHLLLAKYNTADAERTYQEVLEIDSEHPIALVGLARVELQLSNDYTKVRAYLRRAAGDTSEPPAVLLLEAELAILDSNIDAAIALVDKVLENQPKHLEALTIRAACYLLRDETSRFETEVASILKLAPRYARALSEAARYSEQVHRYEEAVALNRRALKIQPNFSTALLGIGIGLSRTGHEDEAFELFRQAFESDPYNVRAFNMVEFYEKNALEYEFVPHDGFLIRAHQKEYEAVNALVSPLVKKALDQFRAKYEFTPDPYLAIEIFPDRRAFAVRSVGLPMVTPHGICFGKVVVSRSPREGNFNWAQVVWHELAHVFHIQLSRSRVPRWFTEGLAEYETNVKDTAWSRHHDRELAQALFQGGLLSIESLNHGFTHSRDMMGLLRAYHQSSLVIHYLVATHGFSSIPAMLKEWGKGRSTEDVFLETLGRDLVDVNKGFETWLSQRFLGLRGQIGFDVAGLMNDESLSGATTTNLAKPRHWLHKAWHHLARGEARKADKALAKAIEIGQENPNVRANAAAYWTKRMLPKRALAEGLAVLDLGQDGYDLRLLLGEVSLGLQDAKSALVHFEAAVSLFPDGVAAWQNIARLGEAQGESAFARVARRRIFELDQNDPVIAMKLFRWAETRGNDELALRASQRWTEIRPFDARSHLARAQTAARQSKLEIADESWEFLLKSKPSEKKTLLLRAIGSLCQAGHRDHAQRHYFARASEAGATPEATAKACK